MVVVSPVWGFYLYEIVYFLHPPSRWWYSNLPSVGYSFVISLILYLTFFIKLKGKTENKLTEAPSTKWLLILMLIYSLVYFSAVSKEWHSTYLYAYVKLTVLVLVVYKLLDNINKIEFALYAYIVGATYIGYEAYTRGRNAAGRVEGIGTVDMPEANGTAAMLVPLIPIMTYFFWRKGWKVKIFIALTGIFIANGLVLINSRGAFLGAAFGFLYLALHLYFSKFRLPKQRLMLIVILLIAIAGVFRFADDTFWERMGTIPTSSEEAEEESGAMRMNFWWATFDIVEDYPFGAGVYGYQLVAPDYLADHLLAKGGGTRAVHSSWFQALSEIGYLGAIVVAILIISILRHLRKAKKHAVKNELLDQYYLLLALQGGLIGFWVSASFINAFRAEVHFWMIMYCMATCSVVLRMKPKQDSTEMPSNLHT